MKYTRKYEVLLYRTKCIVSYAIKGRRLNLKIYI
jgi:hypothetical protein